MKEPLIPFSKFESGHVIAGQDAIRETIPHRFEMILLDGVLYESEEEIVGYKDIRDDEFWVRGHFPGSPLFPGVLMCEAAAQLSAYFVVRRGMIDSNHIVGLGGLDQVRFRTPAVPGDRLVLMLRRGKFRQNVIFSADFQGFIDKALVIDGVVKGVALKKI